MSTMTRQPVQRVVILMAIVGGVLPLLLYGASHCVAPTAVVDDLPFRESAPLEQWTAVLTGFVIKPIYSLLALVLIVILWKRRAPELTALRWAMIFFFAGENFCAANYLLYREQCILFEYLHSYGMVLCFGLTVYALLEGVDRHLIHQSDPEARCAALGLCRQCIKHADVPCALQRFFLFLIPAVLIVALMPFCADRITVAYNTRIFGSPYTYTHALVHQLFEHRYLPAVAMVCLAISFFLLRYKRNDPVLWSKVLFSAGAGALGFSFFRLVLLHLYQNNLVWYAAWEEITELLFLLGVALVLWLFRSSLLKRDA